ncbi:MAG: hypothetical protein IT514_12640 [Burkholderiales bacterium]|nr:hypothetical protein [Burkholderiales bacterium]
MPGIVAPQHAHFDAAPAREQLALACVCRGHVGQFDVAVAADAFGNTGDRHRQRPAVGAQVAQQLGDYRFVVARQLAFELALLGVVERVEPGAAQPPRALLAQAEDAARAGVEVDVRRYAAV